MLQFGLVGFFFNSPLTAIIHWTLNHEAHLVTLTYSSQDSAHITGYDLSVYMEPKDLKNSLSAVVRVLKVTTK